MTGRMSKFLRKLDVFSHFSSAQFVELEACASLSRFAAGSMVISEGESAHEIFVVRKGQIRLYRQTSYGEFTLANLDNGALFGEVSFIDGSPRSLNALTNGDAKLVVLQPEALSAMTQRDQGFNAALYWAFWKSLSQKLRQTNENLTQFFSDTGHASSVEAPKTTELPGETGIDLKARRAVFQEHKLSNMEINFLASLSKAMKLGPQERIFQEGDEGDAMYVVVEGRVMISKDIPGAGEEALAFLERGDFFGEMALIDKQPRSADAKADEAGAVVLAIPREVVEGILDIEKVSSTRLLKILCLLLTKRLREVSEKIVGWHILAGGGSGSTPEIKDP